MNSFDVAIVVILSIFCIKGFFRGIIVEVMTLAGLLIAYVVAIREMSRLSDLIGRAIHLSPVISTVLSFTLIFVLVFLLIRWMASALRRFFQWSFMGWLDRAGGVAAGAFKGAFIASLLALAVSLVPFGEEVRSEQETSFFFKPVRSVAPAVFNLIRKTFPKTKDFIAEVREGASESSRQLIDSMYSKQIETLQKELEERVGTK